MEAICNPKSPHLLNANVLFLLIYGLAGSVYSTPRTIDSSGACNALLQPLEVLIYPGQELFLDSPGFPIFYPSSSFCEWKVSTYNNGYIIQVTTVFVQLENDADIVEVFDGYSSVNHSLLQLSLTIMTRNITIHSSGQRLYIRFRSDSSTNFQGFRFNVTAVPSNTAPATTTTFNWDVLTTAGSNQDAYGACSSMTRPREISIFYGGRNFIESPNYPYSYPSNVFCSWIISSNSSAYVVQLETTLIALEIDSDVIKVYNGLRADTEKLLRAISSTEYTPVVSTGQWMYIEFRSDISVEYTGFRLSYTAVQPVSSTPSNDLNLPTEINSNSAVIISSTLGTMSVVAIFALVFVSLCKRRRRPLRLSVPSGNMAVLYSNVFVQAGSQGGRSAQFNDDIYEVSALYPRMPVSVYPCVPPSYDNIVFTTFCNEEYTEPVPSIPPPEYGDAPPEYSYYQQNATTSV